MYAIVPSATAGSCPDVAVDVGADSVRPARLAVELQVGKLPPAGQLVPDHVEHPNVPGRTRVDDVQLFIVGRKTDAVRLVERVGHHFDAQRLRVHPVYGLFVLLLCRKSLVAAHDSVRRVGEPYAAIRMHHDIVRRIQRLAVVLISDYGHAAIVLVAHHAPSGMLACQLTTFEIECIAVAVARRAAEDADVPVFFRDPHLPVVGNIAPQQVLSLRAPGRPFRPSRADVVAIDDRVEELVLGEALVERHDVRIRIARGLLVGPVALLGLCQRGNGRGHG